MNIKMKNITLEKAGMTSEAGMGDKRLREYNKGGKMSKGMVRKFNSICFQGKG